MLAQAAGFAFLAALSPTALLLAAVYLGSASPRRTMLAYLAGAALTAAVIAVVVLVALHAGGLNHPRQRQPRYGLRLGLGVVALAAGLAVTRYRRSAPRPGGQKGMVSRLMTRPGPVAAFAAGAIVFAPSVTFIAAVQVIATARAGIGLIALGVAVVVAIDVLFAWLPLACHLAAPEATARRLGAFNAWLRAQSRTLLATVLAVTGVLLVIDGISGLAG